MNPIARKAFKEMNKTLYGIVNLHKTREPFQTISVYTSYFWNVGSIYFPRTSYLNLYTEAYTPLRTKYNLAWVGLAAGTVIGTFALINQRYKKSSEEERLKGRVD